MLQMAGRFVVDLSCGVVEDWSGLERRGKVGRVESARGRAKTKTTHPYG